MPDQNNTYALTLIATLVEVNGREYIFNGKAILPDGRVSVELKGVSGTAITERVMNRLLRSANQTK